MAGKNHDEKGSHEEYQYPEEEYVSADAGEQHHEEQHAQQEADAHEDHEADEAPYGQQQENPVIRVIRNNQRVSLVIVVAVIALIGFRVFGSHHDAQLAAQEQQTAQEQKASLQRAVEQAKQINPKVTSALTSVKQAQRNDHNTIEGMQSQLKDLKSAVEAAAQAQSQLSQAVSALAEQMKQINRKVSAHPASMSNSSHAKQAAPQKPVVYHIKAMVDGRAWIVGSNGLSQSVTAGDSIPSYGAVKAVDANQGMVQTSSGKVIRYGSNDQ